MKRNFCSRDRGDLRHDRFVRFSNLASKKRCLPSSMIRRQCDINSITRRKAGNKRDEVLHMSNFAFRDNYAFLESVMHRSLAAQSLHRVDLRLWFHCRSILEAIGVADATDRIVR